MAKDDTICTGICGHGVKCQIPVQTDAMVGYTILLSRVSRLFFNLGATADRIILCGRILIHGFRSAEY